MSDLAKGICDNCAGELDSHEVTKCAACGHDGLCPECAADPLLHACAKFEGETEGWD